MTLARLKFGLAVALMAFAANSCTSGSSKATPNAGTLVVHVIETVGPWNTHTGRPAGQNATPDPKVLVRPANGESRTATTDRLGTVRLLLSPGMYTARLAEPVETVDTVNGDSQ